jgi:DNA polymerase
MAEAAPTRAPVYADRLAARASAKPRSAPSPAPDAPVGHLASLRDEENACTRCPLFAGATQAVPGEGPSDARLLMVGEQPGDQEDLAGRPLRRPPRASSSTASCATRASTARTVFLTNAVKHFKYTIKGVRRIHQSPNGGEISPATGGCARSWTSCRRSSSWRWAPSAAQSLTGNREAILKRRGTLEEGPNGVPVFLTIHPSFLLRLPDPVAKELETERFKEDLLAAKAHLERLAA